MCRTILLLALDIPLECPPFLLFQLRIKFVTLVLPVDASLTLSKLAIRIHVRILPSTALDHQTVIGSAPCASHILLGRLKIIGRRYFFKRGDQNTWIQQS